MNMKIRGVRVPDDLWEAAQTKAATQNIPVSAVVRRALTRYVKRPVTTDEETA